MLNAAAMLGATSTIQEVRNLLDGIRLGPDQLEKLAQVIVAATWRASAQREDLADEDGQERVAGGD